MYGRKILGSLFTAFICYSLLQFFIGYKGVGELKALMEHRVLVNENLDSLKKINKNLRIDLEALKSDPDVIRRHARSVGFFNPGEKVIFIKGLRWQNTRYYPGETLYLNEKTVRMERLIRLGALLCGLAALFILFAGEKIRKDR